MLARRMLMFVAILLAVTALTAGLAPPPPRDAGSGPGATSGPPEHTSGSAVVDRTLSADDVRPVTIELEHGDLLRLTVTGSEADAVELQGLAGLRALTPGTPVTFDVLADAPGEYPVVLAQAARTIGTVRVVTAKE